MLDQMLNHLYLPLLTDHKPISDRDHEMYERAMDGDLLNGLQKFASQVLSHTKNYLEAFDKSTPSTKSSSCCFTQ
jgi:hypothetical protein